MQITSPQTELPAGNPYQSLILGPNGVAEFQDKGPVTFQNGDYGLIATDTNTIIGINPEGGDATVIIPTQAAQGWQPNVNIGIFQSGTGTLTIAPGAGVTLLIRAGLSGELEGQYSMAQIKAIETDVWLLFGDLAT